MTKLGDVPEGTKVKHIDKELYYVPSHSQSIAFEYNPNTGHITPISDYKDIPTTPVYSAKNLDSQPKCKPKYRYKFNG